MNAAHPLPSGEPPGNAYLAFTSTVLSLRGSRTISQPIQDADESCLLCWNGEAWSIAGQSTSGNDTEDIFSLLSRGTKESRSTGSNALDAAATVSKLMASVAGPYAFVFYDARAGKLYLGRDFLGRRSLLWKTNDNGDFLISSITSGTLSDSWTEIEADGIYCIELNGAPPSSNEPKDGLGNSSGFAVCKVPYQTSENVQPVDIASVGKSSSP